MSNICTAILSGNLTADPEVKHEKDGAANIVELRLAVNRRRKDADGDYVDETSFFDLTAFGNFSALLNRKLRKGDAITVKARPEQQRWEQEDGSKRSKVIFIVEDVDAAAMYRKDEDVPAKTEGGTTTSSATSTQSSQKPAPQDDDIPF